MSRRTTALALTTAQAAFLRPLESGDSATPPSVAASNDTPDTSAIPGECNVVSPTAYTALTLRRGTPLHTVTLRLSSPVVRALRKASAQRSLDYVEPFSQQAIAETAIREWLNRNGFAIGDSSS